MRGTTLTREAFEALHRLSRRPVSKSAPKPSARQRAGEEEGVTVEVGDCVAVIEGVAVPVDVSVCEGVMSGVVLGEGVEV